MKTKGFDTECWEIIFTRSEEMLCDIDTPACRNRPLESVLQRNSISCISLFDTSCYTDCIVTLSAVLFHLPQLDFLFAHGVLVMCKVSAWLHLSEKER